MLRPLPSFLQPNLIVKGKGDAQGIEPGPKVCGGAGNGDDDAHAASMQKGDAGKKGQIRSSSRSNSRCAPANPLHPYVCSARHARADLFSFMDPALQKLRTHPALVEKLHAVGRHSVCFHGVDPAAQPFLASLAAATSPAHNVWFICRDVRHQETFAADVADWIPSIRIFPEIESSASEDAVPDAETVSERLFLLSRLAAGESGLHLVIHADQLHRAVPAAHSVQGGMRIWKVGQKFDPAVVASELTAAGYDRVPQVYGRGQFSVRGGVVDVFSWQAEAPVRVDLFGDEIESIREFDLDAQTSQHRTDRLEVLLGDPDEEGSILRGYIRDGDLQIDVDGEFVDADVRLLADPSEDGRDSPAFLPTGMAASAAGDLLLDEARRAVFFEDIRGWLAEEWDVIVFCNNEGETERFREIVAENGGDPGALRFAIGRVSRGFLFPAARLAVLSDAEIFGRAASQRARTSAGRRERARARRQAVDYSEFEDGDLVVHLEHGIGRYLGMQQLPGGVGQSNEVLVLEYANESRLFVPLDQAWQVSRYVGVGKKAPPLSEMGDGKWQRARRGAERAILAYAERLLAIQADRLTGLGRACQPDGPWQHEFESAFLFKFTADQTRSLREIKADMESSRPMDRLLCGDVGFGKTEVAVRAAFKAVVDGRQVAILAPTTVLAQQHFQTCRERMSDYPVSIDLLNRYRSGSEQKKTIERLKAGEADIVVGTHRLISGDVEFKDLGLVIVDEEQRFGVAHKEKLKERFRSVDVLTLSATPIPRTLYMALVGARDMSVIETPPPGRQPVETVVCAFDERVIRDAIQRELARGGQVYFLHNRVRTIEKMRERIVHLCPGARVDIGHGQMEQGELEEVMRRFIAGQTDVLVSTTIIESGLDIPNANTILIDRADRFGLADLYQLRGRVGRAGHKAYAYLLLPRELMAVGDARKRVNAIKQYSELGAGFKIAMRDLEIRGAGNILGTAQSGHIVAVGFELYCRMLKTAVAQIKGEASPTGTLATVRIDFMESSEADFVASPETGRLPAFLPTSYVGLARQRIEAYRRIAEVEDHAALETLGREWRDRFGRLPEAAENLLLLTRIRLVAGQKKITLVETREGKLMLTRKGDFVLIGGRFPRLTGSDPASNFREVLHYLESF